MGACESKLNITDEFFIELKSNPNDKLLLMLQVHYELYDKESKKKIDEVCQLALMTDRSLHIDIK
jgi:hypothetical protein